MHTSIEPLARTLDYQVDTALQKMAVSPTLTLGVNELYDVDLMNENAYLLDHFMLEKGLIKIAKEGRSLTGKGLEISNFGGWLAYQSQLKKDKTRNLNLQSTLKYERELTSLRDQIETQRRELKSLREKEEASEHMIKNLLFQKKNNRQVLLLAGVVIGVVCSSLMWYFFNF